MGFQRSPRPVTVGTAAATYGRNHENSHLHKKSKYAPGFRTVHITAQNPGRLPRDVFDSHARKIRGHDPHEMSGHDHGKSAANLTPTPFARLIASFHARIGPAPK